MKRPLLGLTPLLRGTLSVAIGLMALLATASVSTAFAAEEGLYIETVNRSKGIMGEGPREEVSKTYVAHERMKVVSSDPQGTDMILDPAAGTMTFLNNEAKEYYQIDAKGMAESMSQPGLEQMRAMVEKNQVSVAPTDETRTINDWECRKYQVRKTGMMEVEQEIWATQDVDIDLDRYTDLMSMSGPNGLLGDSAAAKAQREEMSKIEGYPILTKTQMDMMGSTMETESEVIAIRKEPMEASFFEIPEGYTERDMGTPGSVGGHSQ